MLPVSTREVTTKASWPTATAAKVQPATLDAEPSPTPRQPHTGRNRKPMRLSGTTSTTAWAATPRVALPATSQIIAGVQSSTPASRGFPSRRKAPSPAMLTMLASAGAHMYAVKWPRALSTWPRRV